MTRFTIELNEETKIGKTFVAFIEAFIKGKKGIHITENTSQYNASFVKTIKEAERRGSYITVDPKDVWGSLSLK